MIRNAIEVPVSERKLIYKLHEDAKFYSEISKLLQKSKFIILYGMKCPRTDKANINHLLLKCFCRSV